MDYDPVLQVPFDGSCEDRSLYVSPKFFELVDIVSVVNRDDVLFDDGTRVQFFSDVVGGSAYPFQPRS